MNGRFFKEINSVIDGITYEGMLEKCQKRYRETKLTLIIITLVLLIVSGGIIYFHLKGNDCTIPVRILIVIDVLMLFLYLRWKYF